MTQERGSVFKTPKIREKFLTSNCAPVFQGVRGRGHVGGGLRREVSGRGYIGRGDGGRVQGVRYPTYPSFFLKKFPKVWKLGAFFYVIAYSGLKKLQEGFRVPEPVTVQWKTMCNNITISSSYPRISSIILFLKNVKEFGYVAESPYLCIGNER